MCSLWVSTRSFSFLPHATQEKQQTPHRNAPAIPAGNGKTHTLILQAIRWEKKDPESLGGVRHWIQSDSIRDQWPVESKVHTLDKNLSLILATQLVTPHQILALNAKTQCDNATSVLPNAYYSKTARKIIRPDWPWVKSFLPPDWNGQLECGQVDDVQEKRLTQRSHILES